MIFDLYWGNESRSLTRGASLAPHAGSETYHFENGARSRDCWLEATVRQRYSSREPLFDDGALLLLRRIEAVDDFLQLIRREKSEFDQNLPEQLIALAISAPASLDGERFIELRRIDESTLQRYLPEEGAILVLGVQRTSNAP